MKQFESFKKFVDKINHYGMKSGIVKIIAPKEWFVPSTLSALRCPHAMPVTCTYLHIDAAGPALITCCYMNNTFENVPIANACFSFLGWICSLP